MMAQITATHLCTEREECPDGAVMVILMIHGLSLPGTGLALTPLTPGNFHV